MRILLLEDDRDIGNFVASGLRREQFAVDWTETGEKGLMLAKVNAYDLGIFDIKLAGRESGIQVCRALRAYGKTFPILMLSVTSDVVRKVEALEMGADDYLAKPFSFVELMARVRALLRREKRIVGPILTLGDLSMDTQSHVITRAGKAIALNRKEFMLLEYLMRNPGTVLTRTMILEHVWDMNADPFTNTVDVHMRFLRKKIDEPFRKKLLKTVHGYGYKIEA
jgi:DNA-binding response OmpR family regulator